jgi:hypothetical protein
MLRTAFLAMGIVSGLGGYCEGQTSPVIKVHAYQRDVVAGIPGGPPGVGAPARQPRYFIYLETSPDSEFAVDGVWVGGELRTVDTSIKKPPVRFETAVKLADDSRTIAVPATNNKVTEIVVKDAVPGKTPDTNVTTMLRDNQAVVQLRYLDKPMLIPVAKFEKRDPLYMR